MKQILRILSIFVSIYIIYGNTQVFAQFSGTYPCETDFSSGSQQCQVPWNGPFVMNLCTNDFQMFNVDCGMNCCFKVIYYDREIDCDSMHSYDVQIQLIDPEPENCWDCFVENKDDILKEFLYIKMQEHSDFFSDFWGRQVTWNHKAT